MDLEIPYRITMTENQIIEITKKELQNPTDEWAKLYLEVHKCETKNGEFVISKIDIDEEEQLASVYLPVENERFYFALGVDTKNGSIRGIWSVPCVVIQFVVVSDTKTGDELAAMTKIKPLNVINKGDYLTNSRTAKHLKSSLTIGLKNEPNYIENHIEQFANLLHSDLDNIKQLATNFQGKINITIIHYTGTGFLGDFALSPKLINKLAKLNIPIHFFNIANGHRIPTPIERKMELKPYYK